MGLFCNGFEQQRLSMVHGQQLPENLGNLCVGLNSPRQAKTFKLVKIRQMVDGKKSNCGNKQTIQVSHNKYVNPLKQSLKGTYRVILLKN